MTLVPEEQGLLQLRIHKRGGALGLIRAGRVELSFDGVVFFERASSALGPTQTSHELQQ